MKPSDFPTPDLQIIKKNSTTPMDAVNSLYAEGDEELSAAIIASLSAQVFADANPAPSSSLRKVLAMGVLRLLKRTTRKKVGPGGNTTYSNRILERSKHPYALTLLGAPEGKSQTFVEGGDPMNAPYMMISPEIREHAGRWDRLLLSSMHGRDVQLRFIYEARSIYSAAKTKLEAGQPVGIKAAAAGTGLCLILVIDRLIRDGYDPALIKATISDRDPSNVTKAERLVEKLPTTRGNLSCVTEDLLSPDGKTDENIDVMTLVGILEYFCGHTCTTTEGTPGDETEAPALVAGAIKALRPGGVLIANSYKPERGGRIIEVFGKTLRFRTKNDLHALMASVDLKPQRSAGHGHVYDVELYQKPQAS